jgi:hypothetical protein
MQKPPLLPEHALARVRSIARHNGLSVLLIASVAAVLEASRGATLTAVAGVIAAGAGAMEVHGAGLLQRGLKRGMAFVIRGELLLLGVIWLYCGFRLARPDLTELRATFQASLEIPIMQKRWAEAQQLGLTEEQYLNAVYQLTYIGVAFVTLLYQGGMIIYYSRRQRAVELALGEE